MSSVSGCGGGRKGGGRWGGAECCVRGDGCARAVCSVCAQREVAVEGAHTCFVLFCDSFTCDSCQRQSFRVGEGPEGCATRSARWRQRGAARAGAASTYNQDSSPSLSDSAASVLRVVVGVGVVFMENAAADEMASGCRQKGSFRRGHQPRQRGLVTCAILVHPRSQQHKGPGARFRYGARPPCHVESREFSPPSTPYRAGYLRLLYGCPLAGGAFVLFSRRSASAAHGSAGCLFLRDTPRP